MESWTHFGGGWQWRPTGRRPTNPLDSSRLTLAHSWLFPVRLFHFQILLDSHIYLPAYSPEKFTEFNIPDILHNSWKLSRRLFGYAYLVSNGESSIFLLSLLHPRFHAFTLSTLSYVTFLSQTVQDLPIFAISRLSCESGKCTFLPQKSQFLVTCLFFASRLNIGIIN